MQTYIRTQKSRRQLQALIAHALKSTKKTDSKIIKTLKIGTYTVYYFRQASFTFLLATQIPTRINRMQNYLRVVADIFYQNYDEKKFQYVLNRIMEEINRTQFGGKRESNVIEDQESSLVGGSLMQDKIRFSSILSQRERMSSRAYIVAAVLFICIAVLSVYYLYTKWS